MKKRLFILIIATVLLVSAGVGVYAVVSGARVTATLVEEKADIGIPGISKMYGVRLRNQGLIPVRVTRCDYITDSMSPGRMLAYAVQRWDSNSGSWKEVVEDTPDRFCKPYPMGILKAEMVSAWLLPGQSLETEPEATAARRQVKVGDKVRFVVFTSGPGDYRNSVATDSFVIDQIVTDRSTNFRVKH